MITKNGFGEIMTTKPTEQGMVAELSKFTREELRLIAKKHNVKRGRDKADTIINLIESGRLKFQMTLSGN